MADLGIRLNLSALDGLNFVLVTEYRDKCVSTIVRKQEAITVLRTETDGALPTQA